MIQADRAPDAPGPAGRSRAGLPLGPQAPAAYRQKSRISAVGVGPAISTWVSRMVTVPVDGVMCAAVPVPPTQP